MLSADDQIRLARLQLVAKGVVDGIVAGRHRSRHAGASVAFKEHRQYVRGDEIRSIDWKLFGKTDRLFIRQYEDETNLRAMILLDQSGSMAYRGTCSTQSKHQFAVQLAACLATLLVAQQDSVGLATFDAEMRQLIPPRGTTGHLQAITTALIQSECGAETALEQVLQQAARQLRRRGLLILISDCFANLEALTAALQLYRQNKSQVIVFQIWDRDELEFPFRSRAQFRSLENADVRRAIDPRALRDSYLRQVADFQQQLAQSLARERIDLVVCTTDQDFTDVLSVYLSRRADRQTRHS